MISRAFASLHFCKCMLLLHALLLRCCRPVAAPAFGRIHGHGCCAVMVDGELLVNFDSSSLLLLLSNDDDGSGGGEEQGEDMMEEGQLQSGGGGGGDE